MLRDRLKAIRNHPVVNWVATSVARSVGLRNEFFVSHLPRRAR